VCLGARLMDRSGRRKVVHLEAFLPCCVGEAVVERDDLSDGGRRSAAMKAVTLISEAAGTD
jgi:hypothetical protein